MPRKHPILVILGGFAALALGGGIGLLVGKTDETSAGFGRSPKTLTTTKAEVSVPAMPSGATLPALHTETVPTTESPSESEGEIGADDAEGEAGSEIQPYEGEVITPAEKTVEPVIEKTPVEQKTPVTTPTPHSTVRPEVTVAETE
jgi:hypothetical protein